MSSHAFLGFLNDVIGKDNGVINGLTQENLRNIGIIDAKENGPKNDEIERKEKAGTFSFPTPTPQSTIIGMTLYPKKHMAALKSTASPATLQSLHEQGELLLVNKEPELQNTIGLPYCTLAMQGASFPETRQRLEHVLHKIGIEAPELVAHHYN
jgi:hypothetical protein